MSLAGRVCVDVPWVELHWDFTEKIRIQCWLKYWDAVALILGYDKHLGTQIKKDICLPYHCRLQYFFLLSCRHYVSVFLEDCDFHTPLRNAYAFTKIIQTYHVYLLFWGLICFMHIEACFLQNVRFPSLYMWNNQNLQIYFT